MVEPVAASAVDVRLDWFLDRLRDGARDLADDALGAVWITESPTVSTLSEAEGSGTGS